MNATDRKTWLVLPHHEQRKPTGRGYVVRPSADGETAEDQYNYGNVPACRAFSSKVKAEKQADRLNGDACSFWVYVQMPTGWARCRYGCTNRPCAEGLAGSFRDKATRIIHAAESEARSHFTIADMDLAAFNAAVEG